MTLYIRNFDEQIGRRLKAAAALRGLSLGGLVTQIVSEWLDAQPEPTTRQVIEAQRAALREN